MLPPMLKALVSIARVATCCTVVLLSGACGNDDKQLSGYAEGCQMNEDCEKGLTCITGGLTDGICTLACTSTAQCMARSAHGTCADSYCYDACTPTTGACPNGLTCTMAATTQGTCRLH
jgi:hypothetical protein